MILDSSGLTTLRQHPHGTKLWMSVYVPKILLAGQVDDASINKGELEIAIDNISTGSISAVY